MTVPPSYPDTGPLREKVALALINSVRAHHGLDPIRWDVFENFLSDMGPKPGKGYSIERMDNDGNYEPSNCKWATQLEQNRNKRNVYTAEEDRKIREAIARGYNFSQMAAFVGRSEKGVTARAYRLGLGSGQRVPTKITDRTSRLPSTDLGGRK